MWAKMSRMFYDRKDSDLLFCRAIIPENPIGNRSVLFCVSLEDFFT